MYACCMIGLLKKFSIINFHNLLKMWEYYVCEKIWEYYVCEKMWQNYMRDDPSLRYIATYVCTAVLAIDLWLQNMLACRCHYINVSEGWGVGIPRLYLSSICYSTLMQHVVGMFCYLSDYCLTGCTLDLCTRSLILLKWSLISCFYHFFQEIITNFRLWKIFTSVFAFQSTPELMFGLYLLYYFRVFERQIGSNKYSVGTLPFVIISSLGQNFK